MYVWMEYVCCMCMLLCVCMIMSVSVCTYDMYVCMYVCMYVSYDASPYCFSSQKSYEYLESNRESSEIDT
jgi:hypothetical protein